MPVHQKVEQCFICLSALVSLAGHMSLCQSRHSPFCCGLPKKQTHLSGSVDVILDFSFLNPMEFIMGFGR